ncbi:20297_t:CDS:2 [Cetraspora pellucida]|uniref:20297_t:CDS:1 n=1 Tax=Cetraspora pellucida TaxID=1433469 RepID=A0A9N9JU08_9GLOM|nr:20297_t:CDS:2 [Cetraspora pellucida]
MSVIKDNLLYIIIVVSLLPTVIIIFVYVLLRVRQRQRHQQSFGTVDYFPTKIFYSSKRKENEPQECVVCLEDYNDGDKLRILPCKHEFHVECIDSFLTTRKNICPICKRTVLSNEEIPTLPSQEDQEVGS